MRDWLGGGNLHGKVSRVRDLICWLSWVYKDLDRERAQTMWNLMSAKPYSSGSLKATAKWQLCEQITKDMLIHVGRDTPKPAYLHTTGITPFFTGAQIIEDTSLCVFFRDRLEPVEGDSDYDKKQKELLRKCVATFVNKHQSCHDFIVCLCDDTKAALTFAKRLVKSVGIQMISTEKRVQMGDARKRIQEVVPPAGIMALAFAMKDTWRNRLLEILPTMMGGPNLSELDKIWIGQSLDTYNEAAVLTDKPELQISLACRPVSVGVIAQRVREANVERAVGGGNVVQQGEDERVAQALLDLTRIEEQVGARVALGEQQHAQRVLTRAAAQVVVEEDGDDDDGDEDVEDDEDDDDEVGRGGGVVFDESEQA